jgi:hypothetical protein
MTGYHIRWARPEELADDPEPTVALLRRLAAALDADVRLTPGHDLGSVWFETHAASHISSTRFAAELLTGAGGAGAAASR